MAYLHQEISSLHDRPLQGYDLMDVDAALLEFALFEDLKSKPWFNLVRTVLYSLCSLFGCLSLYLECDFPTELIAFP